MKTKNAVHNFFWRVIKKSQIVHQYLWMIC